MKVTLFGHSILPIPALDELKHGDDIYISCDRDIWFNNGYEIRQGIYRAKFDKVSKEYIVCYGKTFNDEEFSTKTKINKNVVRWGNNSGSFLSTSLHDIQDALIADGFTRDDIIYQGEL